MLGFEIKFRNKTLLLPLETIITITNQNGGKGENISTNINAGLYDPLTNNLFNWIKENLSLNELIEISIKQIKETSPPLEVCDFHKSMNITKDDADRKTLERFLSLKKELKDEGLI